MIVEHPHERARLTARTFRLETQNIAFQIGHLTATFEHIAQQAEELKMRRELAWARACQIDTQGD